MDFCLTRTWSVYTKEYLPPDQVKHISIYVLRHTIVIATAANKPAVLANARMIIILFFYLLMPGEYTSSAPYTTLFTTQYVQLFMGTTRLRLVTTPDVTLHQSAFMTLESTTQNNGVQG